MGTKEFAWLYMHAVYDVNHLNKHNYMVANSAHSYAQFTFLNQARRLAHLVYWNHFHADIYVCYILLLAAMTYNQVHYFRVNHLADFTQNGHTKIPVG